MAGSTHHARTTLVTEDLSQADWAGGHAKNALTTRNQGGERRTDGHLKERQKFMSKDKSYFGLTIDFMDKLSTADKEERAEMLEPMAVVMMWDSGKMDRNGMDNAQSKRFWELAEQVRPFFESAPPSGVDIAAVKSAGLMDQLLETQEILDATKSSRDILSEYLKRREKNATE